MHPSPPRPVSSVLRALREAAEEGPQQPEGAADRRVVEGREEPQCFLIRQLGFASHRQQRPVLAVLRLPGQGGSPLSIDNYGVESNVNPNRKDGLAIHR